MSLEAHFAQFRSNIIGIDQTFLSPCGERRLVYADWTASGRLYRPIEEKLSSTVGPWVANTHTETTVMGTTMTRAYHKALQEIKAHVGGGPDDAVICQGSGMTGVVNKLQRMLGLRIHEKFRDRLEFSDTERPVVFVTHMEHHSNQTSWLETIAEVHVIEADEEGLVDLNSLRALLRRFADRPLKIAAITSCSNVTGLFTPYHEIAGIMHREGGVCFVDFACSAPYISINMHPADRPEEYLDAIYFSPHKFLGGPGSSGVLVFNKRLYHNRVPDQPGGGTVDWTTPWGEHKYIDDVEAREDGGTPGFLQAIKTALCLQLKEAMGIEAMARREKELGDTLWDGLIQIPGLQLLASKQRERLGVFSFYIEGLHYNLAVRLLNDRYGIQTRGGCSCAGTYGHYLLNVSRQQSKVFTDQIDHGFKSAKPGWVRISIHPTMTDEEAQFIINGVADIAAHHRHWEEDYVYDPCENEYRHKREDSGLDTRIRSWFNL